MTFSTFPPMNNHNFAVYINCPLPVVYLNTAKYALDIVNCSCYCKYLIIHSLQGFSGIIYNTGGGGGGDFARLFKVQFTSNDGMSNDAPMSMSVTVR